MALQPIVPGLALSDLYARLDAVRAAADTIPNKQNAFDLANLLTSVSQKALQTDLAALKTVVDGKASAASVAPLQNALASKVDQSALAALASAVSDKADQDDLSALSTTVGTKASAASVTALTATVGTKASQSSVDTLNGSVAALSVAVSGKAAQSDLASLTQLVNLKATQSAVDALSALVATKIDANQLGGIKPIFRIAPGSTVVQAKASADASWTTLFDYALLMGPAGLNPEIGIDPANQTSLRWRLGAGAWNPLFDLALLKGRDGRDGGLYPFERPGDGIQYFTPDATTREPSAYPDLDTARLAQTVEGRGYDITSAGRVVTKQAFVVEPFEVYRARSGFLRTAAPSDPSGDTFRFGLICLNGAGAVIAEVVLQDWASVSLNTYTTTTRFFSRLSPLPEGVVGLPTGTRSVRLFLQAFGGPQHTVALLLSWNNGGSGGAAGGGAAEAQAAAAAAQGYRDLAAQSASAAQASAVDSASAAPGYATLAQLNADLNWPPGATKQVINDDLNNGTYVKSGAAGTGSWTRFSIATVPGLDVRTREVQPRPAGTVPFWTLGDRLDGVMRALLRLTPQGDLALPRLRVGRVPRRFGGTLLGILGPRNERLIEVTSRGETRVLALRVPRLARAFGSTVGGVFGARNERLIEVLSRGETRVPALRVPRLARAFGGSLFGILGPRAERALAVTDRLDTRILRLRLARLARFLGGALGGIYGARAERLVEVTSRGETRVLGLQIPVNRDRTKLFLARVMSGNRAAFLDFLPSGRIRLEIHPPSFVASRLAARRDPEDVIALGGAGQITDVHVLPGPGRRMGYSTTADGVFAPYVLRRDLLVQGPHLLMPGRTVEGQISYGQSWRCEGFQVDALTSAFEPRRAMLLARISGGQLSQVATIGSSDGIGGVATFWGLRPGSFVGIGAAAMMARQRLRTAGLVFARTLIDTNASFPGYRWDQLKPGTDPWAVGLQQRAKATEIAAGYGATVTWRSVGWTHGAAPNGQVDGNGNPVDYYAVLTELVAAHDALALNGSGGEALKYFIDQTAPVSGATMAQDAILTQAQFALDRSDRVFNIGPRYPYAFRDDIHHTPFGYLQVGELEGYAKFVALDLGLPWTPARPTAISVSGATVTIQVARPYGMGGLTIDTTSIEAAPQNGLHVRVGGAERTVSNVVASGDTVALTLSQAIPSGTSVEVSNAFYGPGAPVGTHSGVWGNVKRTGPASQLLPGRTIDAWLTVFRQTVTAA